MGDVVMLQHTVLGVKGTQGLEDKGKTQTCKNTQVHKQKLRQCKQGRRI